jgi:nitrous oxide reductase accessory protein NosL
MSSRAVVIAALTLLSAACHANVAGAPQIVVDTTACSHCGMLVSEPAYAAARRLTM